MPTEEPTQDLLAAIALVTAKRPRTVLTHILAHGFITTDELKDLYGYNHPPRAARDVREAGIPLETFKVKGPDGRSIAAYRLPAGAAASDRAGRRAYPKAFKDLLLATYGEQCTLCGAKVPGRALQIDHRIPYEIAGEPVVPFSVHQFMLLCASCNRSKSWSCENCPNYTVRDKATCATCGWASPESYLHLATKQQRRLTLVWQAEEIVQYELLESQAAETGEPIANVVKRLLGSDP
jgi:hypothetical protein